MKIAINDWVSFTTTTTTTTTTTWPTSANSGLVREEHLVYDNDFKPIFDLYVEIQ